MEVKRYSENPNNHWSDIEQFRKQTFIEGNNSLGYDKYDPEDPNIETWMCYKYVEEWENYKKPSGKIKERLKPGETKPIDQGNITTGSPPPEIKKWEPPVSGGKIDIPLTTGGSEIPELKKEDLIFTSQTAEGMLEEDDHSQDEDVLEVKKVIDSVK